MTNNIKFDKIKVNKDINAKKPSHLNKTKPNNYKKRKQNNHNKTNKGKIKMCQKLNELSGMTSAKVLERYCADQSSYAINMGTLMKNIGVSVFIYDFTEFNRQNDQSIYGAIVLRGDDLAVFVSEKCTQAEQRFILAHELAHCCLHGASLKSSKIECASNFDSSTPHEREADEFADQLLLPEKVFLGVCSKFKNQIDVNLLSEIFCVPTACVRRRMKALGII